MIKRLIFDIDGTLIKGVNFVSSIEKTLKRLDIYSENNINRFLEAISKYEAVYNNYNKKDYISHLGKYLDTKLDDRFLIIFFEELKSCVPFECVKLKNALFKLYKEYELVLLTNYFKESQLNRLNTMGIKDLFLECFGEELIKPNDEIYLKACGPYNPNECVMIGDDIYLDVKKPKSLGLHTIFVNSKGIVSDFNTISVSSVEEISSELIEQMTKYK